MNTTNPVWANKSVWVNVVALIAIVLTSFGIGIDESSQAAMVGGVMVIVNIILHCISHKAINDAKASPPAAPPAKTVAVPTVVKPAPAASGAEPVQDKADV